MTASRQPAGIPTGGQFAPSAQPRAQLTLVVDPPAFEDDWSRRRQVLDVADELADDSRRNAAVARARELMPDLGQADFDAHVAAITEASKAVRLFEDNEDAAYELPKDSPLWGDVDLDAYAGFDEDGGLGYDFGEATKALATHWGDTHFARAKAAFQANDAARETLAAR
jgi:hypothetical protein